MKLILYIALLCSLFVLNLVSGSSGFLGLDELLSSSSEQLLWSIRLPAAMTALLAGGALAVAGLLMQVLFQNPLAGPGVMGISSGAGLLVSLSMLAGIGHGLGLIGMALLGALLTLSLILLASFRLLRNSSLLILGLMLGYMISSTVSILEYSARAESLQRFVYWSMGNFQAVGLSDLLILGPLIGLVLLSIWFMRSRLDVLLLGSDTMKTLGYSSSYARLPLLLSIGLLVGVVTAYCGPLAFIGLAAPHIARLTAASDLHRFMIPQTVITGAILALTALYVVNAPWIPFQLPLNAVLSIIGAPVVIWLIIGANRANQTEL